MTTETLTRLNAFAPAGFKTFPAADMLRSIVTGYKAWRDRCAAVQHLDGLNDSQLSDIGIARCDIERAVVSGLRSKF